MKDSFTGYDEKPIAEAPPLTVVLAKSRDGATYMKVWQSPDGAWCLDGTRHVARPKPHTWLVPPQEENMSND